MHKLSMFVLLHSKGSEQFGRNKIPTMVIGHDRDFDRRATPSVAGRRSLRSRQGHPMTWRVVAGRMFWTTRAHTKSPADVISARKSRCALKSDQSDPNRTDAGTGIQAPSHRWIPEEAICRPSPNAKGEHAN
jgi:hypothetical protein